MRAHTVLSDGCVPSFISFLPQSCEMGTKDEATLQTEKVRLRKLLLRAETNAKPSLGDSRAPALVATLSIAGSSVPGSRGLGKAGTLPGQEQIVCLASLEGCDLGGEVPMGLWEWGVCGWPRV